MDSVTMNDRLSRYRGGLFSESGKADIGEGTDRLRRAGTDILAWADPFFPDSALDGHLRAALHSAIDDAALEHYTVPIGDRDLREALAVKLETKNGIAADPSRNLVVTPGADAGLFLCMMALLNVGDEVLVPEPGFPAAFSNCDILGAVPVPVALRHEGDGYDLDIEALESAVTPRTTMVFLAHPNNPTSTVFRPASLRELAEFVVRHDLILLCDQAFEDHIFDDLDYLSPATLPGMADRTVTLFSFSKGYGLSGFRVAYVHACAEIMDVLHGNVTTICGATSTIGQQLALAALADDELLAGHRRRLDRRRRSAYEEWSTIPGVRMQLAESGLLSWLDISALGTSADVVAHLLEHANVLVNDGGAYGPGGAGHIRVVHGIFLDDEKAERVFRRMRDALMILGGE